MAILDSIESKKLCSIAKRISTPRETDMEVKRTNLPVEAKHASKAMPCVFERMFQRAALAPGAMPGAR